MKQVRTKFTMAVVSCLKQWSKAKCVESMLKQSFSMSQRLCPARHKRRVLSRVLERVLAQYQEDVSSFSCLLICSRRRTVSSVCSTRNGTRTPSHDVKPSSSQDRTQRRASFHS